MTSDDQVEPSPYWLSEQRQYVAKKRHFELSLHPLDLFDSDAANKLYAAIVAAAPHKHAMFAFEKTLKPLLAHVSRAEMLGRVGRKGAKQKITAAQQQEWTAAYLERMKGGFAIKLDAPGVRQTFAFWWWLICSDGALLLEVPRKELDVKELFAHTLNPVEHNINPTAVVLRGRERAASGKSVFFHPHAAMNKIGLSIMASAKDIRMLHDRALELAPLERRALLGYDGCVRPADQGITQFFVEVQYANDPEQFLRKALQRGASKLADKEAVENAIYAAEIIAGTEGRGSLGLVLREQEATEQAEWAKRQGPLATETLTLARTSIDAIAKGARFDRKWVSETEIEPWTHVMSELAKRLQVVESTRGARLKASNAAPLVIPDATRKLAPDSYREWRFYAATGDIDVLFDVIRASGAKVYRPEDTDLSEIKSRWEMRETISPDEKRTIMGVSQTRYYIWWPDVGGVAELLPHYFDSDEVDHETGARRKGEGVWYGPGWGMARILFRREVKDPKTGNDRTIAESILEHPTPADLDSPRFRLPGTWHDVDWKVLRRSVSALRQGLAAVKGGAKATDSVKSPVLPEAASLVRDGWALADSSGIARPVKLAR